MNFRLAVAETGSIADRDRFAGCPIELDFESGHLRVGGESSLHDGRIRRRRRRETRFAGRQLRPLIGPSELGLWPDDTQQRFGREIKKTHGIRGFELEMRAKNGERVACLVSAEAVAINDDQRVLFVLQDVTDRKRSEEELIAAIEQVMADTSWFSRSIVEKLAALRRPVSSPARDAELEG
jgi:PAS domain-containing protein